MFKKYTNLISTSILILTVCMFFVMFAAVPFVADAQSLTIPCDGFRVPCDFPKLVELASNIMTFLILLTIPIATIAIAWAGWLILTAGGNSGKVDEAKEIFTKVLIGFFFALTAWLLVELVTGALLDKSMFESLFA